MENRILYKRHMISYEYGFNHMFIKLYVNKRIGQLVKADITPIEGDSLYISSIGDCGKYAAINFVVDTKSFRWINEVFDLILDNIKIDKYINFNSHRLSYELLRALS